MTAPTARELIQRLTDELEHATDHNYQQALKAQASAFLAAKLSPAAKFVLNAVLPLSDEDLLYTCTDEQYAARMAAVALQAAANVVAPEAMPHRRKIRDEILAIAAELETSTPENR